MTVLKSFDFAAARSNQKWNWEMLTDGNIRKLVKGKDYHAKYAAAQVRVYAKAHGLTVNLSGGNPGDDEMVVQFVVSKKSKKTRNSEIVPTAEAAEVNAE
jgi:hypothetical protein